MNNLNLKAMRQSLGLTVAEASELIISPRTQSPVSKRTLQRYEAGSELVPSDVDILFFNLGSQYQLALDLLEQDIKEVTIRNEADDTKPSTVKPVLPFFHTFEAWQEKTGNNLVHFWKIYQSVIGHLILVGKLAKLDDNANIPKNFSICRWIELKYDSKGD